LRKHVYAGFKGKIRTKFNPKLVRDILVLPIRSTLKIFNDNREFFWFEMAFFIYGSSLMILSPVIPIYLVQTLHLDYAPISIARGFLFYSAIIMLTPLMGKFEKRLKPAKFCGYLFLGLLLFPAGMIVVKYLVPSQAIIVLYI